MSTERWVLVAGGSGGLGSATCCALADDGWDVALTYRSDEVAAREVAEAVTAAGRRAAVFQVSLEDEEAAAAVVARVGATGTLGGVVYAANPHITMRYISGLKPTIFRAQIAQDAIGCFNLLQPALPLLRESAGAIVAVVTPALRRYAKKDLLSVAPKAAVEAIVHGVAAEEGRYGVRANCVGAGLIEGSGMWRALIERGDYTDEMLAIARHNIPLRRFGSAGDVAEAVRFLMSQRSGWITGHTLMVDGGYSV